MTLVPKFSGSSSGASGDSDMVDRQRYGNIRKMFGVLIFHFQTCATSKIHSDRFRRQLKTAVSYWTGFFIIIVMEEHFIFQRKGGKLGGYNLDDWDSPSK